MTSVAVRFVSHEGTENAETEINRVTAIPRFGLDRRRRRAILGVSQIGGVGGHRSDVEHSTIRF